MSSPASSSSRRARRAPKRSPAPPAPPRAENGIYCADSRDLSFLPDGCVTLVICSPPYNVQKPYQQHDDDLPRDQYLGLLKDVWTECRRVLRPGGRICVNVAGCWRQPYFPLHSYITMQLEELGFLMRGEIIWDKGASVGVSTAWGSFASPSNPVLRDVHEYILVFSKDSFRLEPESGAKPDIANDRFVEYTRSIWQFPTVSASKVGHPAAFPLELPRRLIKLYSYPGDLVLDPFCGSGTTCLAARELDRRWIGVDIDPRYVFVARQRLGQGRLEMG